MFKPPQRDTLSAQVERNLREAMMSGRFRPGERLNIRALATALGTSPTPVREALSRFAAEGAIEFNPGQSVRIPEFKPEVYSELIAIRMALESVAVERAVERITDEEIGTVEATLKKYGKAVRAGKKDEILSLSKKFRFGIYESARMPELLKLIEALWTRTAPSLRLMYENSAEDPALELTYSKLLNSLKVRDKVQAKLAVERAISIALERLFIMQSSDKKT